MRFQDKVAVVTGASMGIGKAAALAFAREGATVVIVDINRDQAEGAVKEIQAQSGDAHFIRADVSKEREVRTLIDEVMRRWKRLDVLVNNAGVYVQGDAAEVSLSDWERILAVNLTGPFLCTKHAVPAMIKSGGGVIVNVGSEAGLVGIRNQVAYNVSKGGVIALTRSCAARSGFRSPTSLPSMKMCPLSTAMVPLRIFISVDFPAPFSPNRTWTSPSYRAKSTWSRACTPGKALSTCSTLNSG